MDIIGHRKEREHLQALIRRKNKAQAYLFAGPSGIGKSLCAMEFASELSGLPLFLEDEGAAHPLEGIVIRPGEEKKRDVVKQKKSSAEEVRQGLVFLSAYPTVGANQVLLLDEE